MDISFTCAACGKNLVIDEAGVGITIDCPGCGKPVYVPSAVPPAPHDAPARVEVKSSVRKTAPVPSGAAPKKPVMQPRSGPERSSIHPAIAGGVHCLVIVTVMWLVAYVVASESYTFAIGLAYAGSVFMTAAFLCAVYGICVGHVRYGLLVLACVSLQICLLFLLGSSFARRVGEAAQHDIQRQMEQMIPQLQRH
jgi:hypothetical protein